MQPCSVNNDDEQTLLNKQMKILQKQGSMHNMKKPKKPAKLLETLSFDSMKDS